MAVKPPSKTSHACFAEKENAISLKDYKYNLITPPIPFFGETVLKRSSILPFVILANGGAGKSRASLRWRVLLFPTDSPGQNLRNWLHLKKRELSLGIFAGQNPDPGEEFPRDVAWKTTRIFVLTQS